MGEQLEAKLSKWPFFAGDALLVGTGYFIYSQSHLPMGPWQIAFVVLCVAGGAVLGILPFLLEYRLLLKLAEVNALAGAAAQLQNLEAIAAQIGGATGRWQNVQEEAEKTAAAAKTVAQGMAAELEGFQEFMQRANDSEKANLRLETEKLRRAESDWLQALVRVLDHVYALHVGALRSGQPNLIAQVGSFQSACRDAARRVGLAPFAAQADEPFDAQRHQWCEGKDKPPAVATVTETIATGYTFQGRLLRPALVRLSNHLPEQSARETAVKAEAAPQDEQSQLPLEAGRTSAGAGESPIADSQ